MTMWPVDKRVGNVKNNDAGLIEAPGTLGHKLINGIPLMGEM